MRDRNRGRRRQKTTGLCFFQINVGRRGPTHDAALELASKCGADVVLIQEPWVSTDLTHRITKTHPSFQGFSPLPNWTVRHRVMTYIRKGQGLSPFQPAIHYRDLLRVRISWFTKKLLNDGMSTTPQPEQLAPGRVFST